MYFNKGIKVLTPENVQKGSHYRPSSKEVTLEEKIQRIKDCKPMKEGEEWSTARISNYLGLSLSVTSTALREMLTRNIVSRKEFSDGKAGVYCTWKLSPPSWLRRKWL